MKRLIIYVLATLLGAVALTSQAAPDPNFHIYLLLGQSNMEGQAKVEAQDRLPNPRVKVLQDQNCAAQSTQYGQWREALPPLIRCPRSTGSLGLGDTFGRLMAEKSPSNVTIGLVGGAYAGAKIEYFLKSCGSNCLPPYDPIDGAPNSGNQGGYQWVLDLARTAQQAGVIKGFIFHQGESNTGQTKWPTLVNQYISDLRKDLNLDATKVPFIVGELPYTGCCAIHNTLINKLPSVITNAYVVTSDSTLKDKGDGLHWNSVAVREMGKRYAYKMVTLVDVGEPRPHCDTSNDKPIGCVISMHSANNN